MKNQILDGLNNVGICVVEDYFDDKFCDKAIKDIENGLIKYSDKVESFEKEGTSGDKRLYKMQNRYDTAKRFAEESLFLDVVTEYKNYPMVSHFVIGGKVEYNENKVTNSGAGWHKDSGHEVQVKTIVYLNDVDKTNGPFLFIPTTNKINLETRDGVGKQTRYSDETIDVFCANRKLKPFELVAKKGTVIFVDTSYIHRGKNMKNGVRYSYTNYYFENHPERVEMSKNTWGEKYI